MNNTNIKEYPWYIRVNDETREVVKKWLIEEQGYKNIPDYRICNYYTNIYPHDNEHGNEVIISAAYSINDLHPLAKEIKLTFKTTVDTVQYPVLESEHDKQIRQLKETIEKAQKQIEELQNGKK